MYNKVLIMALLSLLLCSCATILKGPKSTVHIFSPKDVKVYNSADSLIELEYIDDNHKKMELDATKSQLLKFSYQDRVNNIMLNPSFQAGWIVPDVICYGVPLVVDAITGYWKGFKNIEIVYLPDDSVIFSDIENSFLQNSNNWDEYRDRKQILRDYYRPRAKFISKYAASTVGWVMGAGAVTIAGYYFGGYTGGAISGLAGNLIIGQLLSMAAISLVTHSYNEHGSNWAAFGGCYVGCSLPAAYMLLSGVFNNGVRFDSYSESTTYFFLGSYVLLPPLFAVLFYDASLPDVYLVPYNNDSVKSLINYNSKKRNYNILPPSFSIERNPFFPNEYITKLNVLSIRF